MYQINEIVVYENGDLYQIKDIGTPDFITSDRKYYTLESLENSKNVVYVTLTQEAKLRPVISRETAKSCLAKLPDLEGQYNPNAKLRDKEYLDVLKNGCCLTRLKMFKGILQEKDRRVKNGKHLCVSDDRYLQKVGKLIDYEFSVALDMPITELHEKITDAL